MVALSEPVQGRVLQPYFRQFVLINPAQFHMRQHVTRSNDTIGANSDFIVGAAASCQPASIGLRSSGALRLAAERPGFSGQSGREAAGLVRCNDLLGRLTQRYLKLLLD